MREASKTENKSVTAAFALGLFAGIRPKEVERMVWEHIIMDTKEIVLPRSITKTNQTRRFTMSENLYEWLSTCDRNQPLVPVENFRKLKEKVTDGLKFDNIQDGLI